MAKAWTSAIQASGHKKPRQAVRQIFKTIWDVLFQRLWDKRNHIFHHTSNNYKVAEDQSLTTKLQWYRENRFRVLAIQDRELANHKNDKIEKMGRKTKRKWITHLDRLSKVFMKELALRKKGQTGHNTTL